METRITEHRHLLDCHIAGFAYWDGVLVFNNLKIGSKLRLVRETDNRFDPYAVAIYFDEYKLGFVPRTDNHQLSKFIEMGYADCFEVRINRVSPDECPESQIGIIIYLKPNN